MCRAGNGCALSDDQGRRRKRGYFEAFLVCASLAVGFILVEVAYRGYLWYTYAIDTNYFVATMDHPDTIARFDDWRIPYRVTGKFPPGVTITFSTYASDGSLLRQYPVRINNLGWVSYNDWDIEKN